MIWDFHGIQEGCMLECVDTILERHMVVGSDLCLDDGFPYSHVVGNDYINPIQHWIKQACNDTQWC
jgi:hypothetical protein